MSHVGELIAGLCPGGVAFRELGDLLYYEQPTKYLVSSTSYNDSYTTPVLTAGQTFILGYTNESAGILLASRDEPVIIFDDFTTAFRWVDFPFKAKSSAMKILRPRRNIEADFKFIYYAMLCIGFAPSEHARHWISQYSKFRIPMPPLEVQHEIVRILDAFGSLAAELEAELGARQRQYTYYRSSLLTAPGADVTFAALGDLFEMRAGSFIAAAAISAGRDDEHPYPCFGGGGRRGYVAEPNQNGDRVLIGRQGALCGNVKRSSGEFYATEHAVVVAARSDVDIGWAFHMLTAMNLNQYASKSAQPGLAVRDLERLRMPVPAYSEQRRIGSILDRFDALVNDVSIGLPAELNARRNQYEYYRDRLLTFPEAA